jgi:polysaccharide biosynthesis/export protein ExoF
MHSPLGNAARAAILLAGTLAFAVSADAQTADSYTLGTQDRLRVKVVEWQTIDGTFKEWTAVSGEYTVGSNGALSIPFVGQTDVAGKTTEEVANVIADTLKRKLGLPDRPEASVELAEYRPIYVAGDVQSPGQFPYAPGLNVVKAVSRAGGMRITTGVRTERDYLQAKGGYQTTADEQLRLRVRAARLDAEASGKDSFALPKEIASEAGVQAIFAEESAIMSTAQKKVALQLQALDELKTLLGNEISSLEKKVLSQKRQMELAQKELDGLDTLADKGLVSNTRQFNAERVLADLQGDALDLDTAILRARQDISKAQQDEIDVRNTRESDVAEERQEVEAKLREATLKLDMYRSLIAEAIQSGDTSAEDEMRVGYKLVREKDGVSQEIVATEATVVLPGDVVKVRKIVPETAFQVGQ